jgi:antitoxin VapB
MIGRSQAVRLPRDMRFEGPEVYIRRDPASGDVILSPKPLKQSNQKRGSLAEFWKLAEQTEVPEDFLSPEERDQRPSRDPFSSDE